MTTPKGYSSQLKEERLSAEFTTIQPVGVERFGLETVSNNSAFVVGTDKVEALTTSQVLVVTGHSAIAGDIIKFTSGALDLRSFYVWATTTNSITLAQDTGTAATTGDDFTIMRYTPTAVTSAGATIASLGFTRNGLAQAIIEDTVTPANNRPLPVKLQDFSGDMVLNATNLNLEVQLTHAGAEPDSVQIGNGTAYAAFGAGANGATVIRTTVATDAPHLLATRHEAAATPISVRLSDGSSFPANGLPTAGRSVANAFFRNDYTGTSVTTLAYTQAVASTSAATHRLQIFDSSGQTMKLAVGAAGSEVDQIVIPPGGIDCDLLIPINSRVSLKAVSAAATVGEIDINFLT